MADLFNFAEVKENVGGGNSQKYIYPGIRHKVVIKNLAQGTTPNGTPYIEIEMYTKEGGSDNSTKFSLYTSEKAAPKSMERIKHIATKVATEDQVNAAKSFEELKDLLKGKSLRMKFAGEEYENKAGEIKEKAVIGYPPFAEAIEEGSEHPVIEDENTKLVFDKKNKYDFKVLEKAPTTDPGSSEGTADKKAAW